MSDVLQTQGKTVLAYQDFIWFWILKTTSAKTIALIDTEVVVSESLRNLLSYLDKEENKSIDLKQTLCVCRTIAKRNVLDAKKKADCKRRSEGNTETTVDIESVADRSGNSNPSDAVEIEDFNSVLVDSLDQQQRQVAKMIRMGNSYRVIAKKLDVCVGTVQTMLKEIETVARLKLKRSETPRFVKPPKLSPISSQRTTNNEQRTTNNEPKSNVG